MGQSMIGVQYTVTHHGRPVGITDLGFTHFDDHVRAGWFFPNGLQLAAAEAFDWHGQFNLELRRPDGSVVPTELIGIHDTQRLFALAAEEEEGVFETDVCFDDDERDEAEWMNAGAPDWMETERPDWMPDVDDPDFPRYQILVRLASTNAVPFVRCR